MVRPGGSLVHSVQGNILLKDLKYFKPHLPKCFSVITVMHPWPPSAADDVAV